MGNVTQIGIDGDIEVFSERLPDLTPPPTLSDYQDAVQNVVDAAAQAMSFIDGVTMASYVTSTNADWATQAQTFVAWRDRIWQYAYAELEKVQAGERPQPTVTDFIRELPPISI